MLRGTIKCDACDWHDKNVVLAYYKDEKCPMCRAPLMSEAEKKALNILVDLEAARLFVNSDSPKAKAFKSADLAQALEG